MVWPALLPPWKRTTTSARLASQSTILPLPSSPHWAPITVTFAILILSSKRLYRAVAPDMRAAERAGIILRRERRDRDRSLLAQPRADLRLRAGRQEDAF